LYVGLTADGELANDYCDVSNTNNEDQL